MTVMLEAPQALKTRGQLAERPVWLLDIDGVINAVTMRPDLSVWPEDDWKFGRAQGYRINWSQTVIDFITGVHTAGRAEIRYHTTWQDKAHELSDLVGLPHFPIQECPEFKRQGELLCAGTWWKLPAAIRVVQEEERGLIWTDDDIDYSPTRQVVSNKLGYEMPKILISPNERTGLSPWNLSRIKQFLIEWYGSADELVNQSGTGEGNGEEHR